jgi:hypothetical protein
MKVKSSAEIKPTDDSQRHVENETKDLMILGDHAVFL